MRQIVLDTETTGLEYKQGHRIIEIGCIELMDRRRTNRHFHQYINPGREIEDGAFEVHGISNEYLADKPVFRDIAADFLDFIRGSELIIHNAPFDVGFLNYELELLGPEWGTIETAARVIDTLIMARERHPGQKNSLDALCQRYHVDNSRREQHGALLDAQILLDIYLAMTGGQATLSLDDADHTSHVDFSKTRRLDPARTRLRVIQPGARELAEHEKCLARIQENSGGKCIWLADKNAKPE